MIRQSLVAVALLALFLAGGTLTVAADPWKDESGHGRHKHKHHKHHKHKYHNHHGRDDKEYVVVIEPQQAPPPEPHIGVQVETGDVSVGGRIRLKR